jgi:hypothetical protein
LFPTYEGDRNEEAHPVGFFLCACGHLVHLANNIPAFSPTGKRQSLILAHLVISIPLNLAHLSHTPSHIQQKFCPSGKSIYSSKIAF